MQKKKANKQIIRELEAIEEKENELIHKVEADINKDKTKKIKIFYNVARFSFNDFAQIVIGCCVFSLAALLDTDIWNVLPYISVNILFWVHLFFAFCVIISLNYEFRDDLKWNKWFYKMLFKQFFYTYFSVFMTMILIMILVNRLEYNMSMLEISKNFLTAQSIGMFGAVTFSFLKR